MPPTRKRKLQMQSYTAGLQPPELHPPESKKQRTEVHDISPPSIFTPNGPPSGYHAPHQHHKIDFGADSLLDVELARILGAQVDQLDLHWLYQQGDIDFSTADADEYMQMVD